ncbi:RhuM family protein [Limnohabitans sp. Rim8]|uniref:RhuM family protein n=1 Tax=Limnohabitans sp. Rim8 TaxID=1100718 RepID=UPI0025DC0A9C|nr:RhuM family protein [Limnohabitans sp. Rim8]
MGRAEKSEEQHHSDGPVSPHQVFDGGCHTQHQRHPEPPLCCPRRSRGGQARRANKNEQPAGEIILYRRGNALAMEVIAQLTDGGKHFMGLLYFAGSQTTKTKMGHAKNDPDAKELKRLNTRVLASLDAAKLRAQKHEPTYMKDWLAHLEHRTAAMGDKTLQGASKVSHQ